MTTLKQWADGNGVVVLYLTVDNDTPMATVDRRPSQWFAPQRWPVPDDVTISLQEWDAYALTPTEHKHREAR